MIYAAPCILFSLSKLILLLSMVGSLHAGTNRKLRAGALDRLLPQQRERARVLAIVARECQQAGQNDWAVELYEAAEQHAAALRLLSHQLALLIPSALQHPQQGAASCQLLCIWCARGVELLRCTEICRCHVPCMMLQLEPSRKPCVLKGLYHR